MSTAHFQLLTPKWMGWFGYKIGIIRVFEHPNEYPPDDYKFFIVGVIYRSICTIHGMYKSDINRKNFRAIYNQLKELAVIRAEWVHNGKPHRRDIL